MALITDYSQPSFYRFSRDSIELANEVADYINFHELVIDKVADYCCGSGVIALEILQKVEQVFSSSIKEVSFVEIQDDYIPHIHRNVEKIKNHFNWINFNISHDNILNIVNDRLYDLIVMNPPYFKAGHGRTSENEKKRICREYEGGELESYLRSAASHLNQSGVLFFVCREDNHLKSIIEDLSKDFFVEKLEEGNGFSIFLLLRSKLH